MATKSTHLVFKSVYAIQMHAQEVWYCAVPQGGNILTSLSWALGSPSSFTNRETTYNKDADNQLPTTNEVAINKATYILNNLLHEENKRLFASKCDDDALLFDTDKYLQTVNSLIVQLLLRICDKHSSCWTGAGT